MRIFAIIFLIVIALSFTPDFVFAQVPRTNCPTDIDPNALLPCGGPTCPCTLCDFFVLIQNLVNFALTRVVPAIAALMILIAGAMMVSAYAGQSGPEMISRAKKLLGALVIGLFIVYLAWVIINMFLMSIGVASWTGLGQWWTINCQAPAGTPIPPITMPGCTDSAALNYNPLATVDDGTCVYAPVTVLGCTDSAATNYNPAATIDDGSCIYPPIPIPGCTDPVAVNYNPSASSDDGSCNYCGNSVFNSGEQCDCGTDGACTFSELNNNTCQSIGSGFTDGILFCNNNCTFDTSGCTTCNNGLAQTPIEECDMSDLDGQDCQSLGFPGGGNLICTSSCTFDTSGCISTPPVQGCMDINAINFDPAATVDDGSCNYCGNNIINSGETCDGTTHGTATCADYGLAPGALACLPDCSGFDTTGCGPVLPPTAGDRLWNCQFNGVTMSKLAGFDPTNNSVYLLGYWSVNMINSTDGFNWFTTCQPGWFGMVGSQGWKDLDNFASTHPDGDYIAYAGFDGSYLFFTVQSGLLTLNQDLCSACPNNSQGLCDPTVCSNLGSTCRNVVVSILGGSFGNMCVKENSCSSCGMVVGDICNAIECTAIGPACSYNPALGTCQ